MAFPARVLGVSPEGATSDSDFQSCCFHLPKCSMDYTRTQKNFQKRGQKARECPREGRLGPEQLPVQGPRLGTLSASPQSAAAFTPSCRSSNGGAERGSHLPRAHECPRGRLETAARAAPEGPLASLLSVSQAPLWGSGPRGLRTVTGLARGCTRHLPDAAEARHSEGARGFPFSAFQAGAAVAGAWAPCPNLQPAAPTPT